MLLISEGFAVHTADTQLILTAVDSGDTLGTLCMSLNSPGSPCDLALGRCRCASADSPSLFPPTPVPAEATAA